MRKICSRTEKVTEAVQPNDPLPQWNRRPLFLSSN